MSKFISVFILTSFILLVNSIGQYERNLARTHYWLLINSLQRLNGTHEDFWAIIDNENLTKNEIVVELKKWAGNKGSYINTQINRIKDFDKQLYKMAEEFLMDLVHSGSATELAKKLYKLHENRDLTWKQTCRQKNQLIRLAEKDVREELKLQLNSWCIPKSRKKRSALIN
ncbi:hypothetical protein M3Y97_00664300 [Aphelenchoides bicaudatus]|nr:hypothetical protein M3Y97_00664300 [Aphelenchoides bicaudatus]